MNIAELIARAHSAGVDVYPSGGQIKVTTQWPIASLPPAARSALGELKRRKDEVTEYFALYGSAPDMNLLTSALRGLGIWPVITEGQIQFYIDRNLEDEKRAQRLLNALRNNTYQAGLSLSMQNIPPPVPGVTLMVLARQECYQAGYCRNQNFSCELFPVMFGDEWLCRRRV